MPVHFRTFSSIKDIERDSWNSLVVGASPMMEWEYFHALEESGSVSEERGYRASHLVAYSDDDHQPMAIAPLYERDRAWVEFGDGGLIEFLSELTGFPYSHGLVGTVPFTPVPGYQFLCRPDVDPVRAAKIILNYIDYICEIRNLSTSRIYFVAPADVSLHGTLVQDGYVPLKSQYCLWFNRDYSDFDDYLRSFKSSRRTKIRRELRTIRDYGIDIRMVRGTDAPAAYYDDMYELYLRTWTKHMGSGIRAFLNRTFFRILGSEFRHRSSFSVASRNGKKIAMAIFYQKGTDIYGRYWGYFEDAPFLHFATCYYYPIQFAIQEGIHMMDPGFGGEHKLFRGYEIVPVYHYVKFYGEEQRRVAHMVLRQMGLVQTNFRQRS